jgi:hypothetical protein
MFSRFGAFIFGFIAGGIFVLGSLKYHVIHADDGVHLVPKMGATFAETYVDIRNFTPNDWADHPNVSAAMVRAGKGHLMKGAAIDSLFDGVEGLLKSMGR